MSLSSKSGLKRTFPEGFGDSACVCVEHVFWAIPRVTKVKMKTAVFRRNIVPRMESEVDINPLESRLEQEWRMESARVSPQRTLPFIRRIRDQIVNVEWPHAAV